MSTSLPYQHNATVHILTGQNKLTVFDQAVRDSGFLAHLDSSCLQSGKSKADWQICIKTNIMDACKPEEDSPTYTDPALVERLVFLIKEQGYTNIAVADSKNQFNYWYEGRTVKDIAHTIGYTLQGYKLIDLSDDQIHFDYGSLLGHHTIPRPWHDADYRISFGKNKTDWQCFYSGCLKNLYRCLPQWNRLESYETKKIRFYEACVLIADRFPVHFGFLDAWTSGNALGSEVREPTPNYTKTIIATENILALDWVQGEKMDINPALNFVLQEAMFRWGTVTIVRKGNMTPWVKWKNISPLVVGFWGIIASNLSLNRFLTRRLMSKPLV